MNQWGWSVPMASKLGVYQSLSRLNWNLPVLSEFLAATFNLKKQQWRILNKHFWKFQHKMCLLALLASMLQMRNTPFSEMDLWKEKHCHLLSITRVVCTNCPAMYCLLFICIRLYVIRCIEIVIIQGRLNENGCTTIWLNDVNSI